MPHNGKTDRDRHFTYLVPERIVSQDGKASRIELSQERGKLLNIKMGIDCVAQHEALIVSLWGSEDDSDWGERPLISFAPKSYCGVYSKQLNLRAYPSVRYLRATWKMHHWGKNDGPKEFTFYVVAEELGSEISVAVA